MHGREQMARGLHLAGVVAAASGVASLSSLSQGAARMFLWPWCLLYVAFALGPWIALLGRAVSSADPIRLPGRAWCWVIAAGCGALVIGTLASPFRSQIGIWQCVPLGGAGWFFVIFDFIAGSGDRQRRRFSAVIGALGAMLSLVSLTMWAGKLSFQWTVAAGDPASLPQGIAACIEWCLARRNDEPLGHVNYTAGLALLFLPWLVWLVFRSRGWVRLGWGTATIACGLVELSSGSRGGMVGLLAIAMIAAALLWAGRPDWRRRILVGMVLAGVCAVLLAVVHPGMRSRFQPRVAGELPNLSNAERAGMLSVGWRAGLDRPVSGWGIGSIPLVYGRYRGSVEYGAINMLQVHSAPFNLWAEGGLFFVVPMGLMVILAGGAVVRMSRRGRAFSEEGVWAAGCSLGGYLVFSFTDYQLDLPVVVAVLACNAGLLAAGEQQALAGALRAGSVRVVSIRRRCLVGMAVAAPLLILVYTAVPWLRARHALDGGDLERAFVITPGDSTLVVMRGLRRAEQSRSTADAGQRAHLVATSVSDLERAIASGAHAEIGHFNLGWLQLGRNPAEARRHFSRVLQIAPAREGAWLGLALASLALGDEATGIDALAMECLAHPAFLSSGWWVSDTLARHRAASLLALDAKLASLIASTTQKEWPAPQARYFREVLRWLAGEAPAQAVAETATSPEARAFFGDLTGPGNAQGSGARQLRGAIARGGYARETLSHRLQRMGEAGDAASVDAMLQYLSGSSPAEAAVRLLSPSRQSPPPIVLDFPARRGFGVRQRNPYAQRVLDGMPLWRNVLAECFVDHVALPHGWVFDQTVRSLADERTRALVDGVTHE